ncbi:reverse transcriptase domain-containing protein [Tanacetum coccineum]|uniref:Reverse transcriptase domain-containing protein n=1 Tax=Tanacetum coccineum TaxID=301880 RepID=A0ABQ5I1X1_9ASTR
MPSHIKTYDRSEDPEDHLKNFQTAAKTERWAMPTWCHMFNSTLTENARVWFDDLPAESIDNYDDLKKAFLENYLQQKKCIKDPIELHNIKQQDGQSTKILKGSFRNQQRLERKHDRFTLFTETPKEIFALEKEKFKAPPPMTTPIKKRNHAKFCEFHGRVGHNTNECMHMKKQIEEMLKAGKLSNLIKELKQNSVKEQPKAAKKGETSRKDKALVILMVQPWEIMARQKITQSFSPNKEIFFPPLGMDEGTEGPMIIEAEIGGHCIHRMYVDGGSASEILYEHCFSRLRPKIKNQLAPATTALTGLSGEIIWPIGQIQLLLTIGNEEHSDSARMNFVVKEEQPPYKSSRMVPLECAMVSEPEGTLPATKPIVEERIRVAINPEYPEQIKPADMTGIPRHIAEHRLNVQEWCSPVRQKKRGQAADRNQTIQEEVEKLVEAGIIKKVHYHGWFNPVMVKNYDSSWRMCVDFKDLNKACPKDGYPLPEIDWKVESLCGFPFKCFLDAYKGYHQIQMAKDDEEKTAFITSQEIFCYRKMPFGLRNAGETYQRLVDTAFHKQISRNLKVYVDDLIIKSRTDDEIVRDIEEREFMSFT